MMASKGTSRGKRVVGVGVALLLALALGWFGRGWVGSGLNGSVENEDTRGVATLKGDSGVCELRVDAGGVRVNGAVSSIADAIRVCRAAGGAELVVTGDARFGTAESLKTALAAAGVPVQFIQKSPKNEGPKRR